MGREEIKNKTVPPGCLLIFEKETCSFGTSPTNATCYLLKGSRQWWAGDRPRHLGPHPGWFSRTSQDSAA